MRPQSRAETSLGICTLAVLMNQGQGSGQVRARGPHTPFVVSAHFAAFVRQVLGGAKRTGRSCLLPPSTGASAEAESSHGNHLWNQKLPCSSEEHRNTSPLQHVTWSVGAPGLRHPTHRTDWRRGGVSVPQEREEAARSLTPEGRLGLESADRPTLLEDIKENRRTMEKAGSRRREGEAGKKKKGTKWKLCN